jgi:hypothetical protein
LTLLAAYGFLGTSLYTTTLQGITREKTQEEVTLAITQLADCDPTNALEESHFHLDIEPLMLATSTLDQKQYWFAAVTAVLIAGC